jgi:hypothetical protein
MSNLDKISVECYTYFAFAGKRFLEMDITYLEKSLWRKTRLILIIEDLVQMK